MANPYESDRLLAEYLLFHYGTAEDILPAQAPEGMSAALDFAVRTTRHFSAGTVSRTLDLGCAVGRSTYELSRLSDEVVGVDFSRNFIEAARQMALGPVAYLRHDEGHLFTPLQALLPPDVAYPVERVAFETGDAMDLREDLGSFDRVHAANLLCRLTHPRRLLDRLPALVGSGGELVLATPATWLEEYTPVENWPPAGTLDWVREALEGSFALQHVCEEPFLIRETSRKYQWSSSQVSVWRRG